MFVRWKKRTVNKRRVAYGMIDAVLVSSYRDEAGRPRQKVVKHLASMPDDKYIASIPGGHPSPILRYRFWKQVDTKLSELPLEDAVRDRLRLSIEATVPRIDESERAALAAKGWL